MARIRSVHPGLWTDEDFVQLSDSAQLLFIGLWNESDDRGLFDWKPISIKIRLRPASNCDINKLLSEIIEVGSIRKFSVGNATYGAIKNFCKWQKPKVPQYQYECTEEILDYVAFSESQDEKPERGNALGRMLCEAQNHKCYYCECDITFYRKKTNSLEIDHKTPVSKGGKDAIENLAACCRKCNSLKRTLTENEFLNKFAPEKLREIHGYDNSHDAKVFSGFPKSKFPSDSDIPKTATREATNQMERRGEERKNDSIIATGNETNFGEFWSSYPRKIGKDAAKKSYEKAIKRSEHREIMAALCLQKWPDDPQFIPHPATWLNQGRWQDDPQAAAPVQGQNPQQNQPQNPNSQPFDPRYFGDPVQVSTLPEPVRNRPEWRAWSRACEGWQSLGAPPATDWHPDQNFVCPVAMEAA